MLQYNMLYHLSVNSDHIFNYKHNQSVVYRENVSYPYLITL